jgi:hypothetical protein
MATERCGVMRIAVWSWVQVPPKPLRVLGRYYRVAFGFVAILLSLLMRVGIGEGWLWILSKIESILIRKSKLHDTKSQ